MAHKVTLHDETAQCYLCGMTWDDGVDEAYLPPCLPSEGPGRPHHWRSAPEGLDCACCTVQIRGDTDLFLVPGTCQS